MKIPHSELDFLTNLMIFEKEYNAIKAIESNKMNFPNRIPLPYEITMGDGSIYYAISFVYEDQQDDQDDDLFLGEDGNFIKRHYIYFK